MSSTTDKSKGAANEAAGGVKRLPRPRVRGHPVEAGTAYGARHVHPHPTTGARPGRSRG